MQTLLEGYKGIIRLPVQWGDMDIGHHVNNVVYLRYLESGRVAYLEALGFRDMASFNGLGPILAEITVQYKAPVTFPDSLHIGTKVIAMDEYSFTMETIIVSEALGRVATKAIARIVTYDYRTKNKAAHPASLVEKVKEIENW